MAVRGVISYWWLPVFSGLVWLGMLLGLLLGWIIDEHRRRLPSMNDGQTIAYISDVGAFRLKPLFIAGACVTTVFLDLSFLAERWLRHNGRLVPNGSLFQKVLAILSILFAIVGTAGLILLSIFDTYHHDKLHDIFLLLFIGGYLLSAVFICWEYQRLGIHNREHRILKISFWIKLIFILVELCLAITFASTSFTGHYNVAAVFEWVVAFIFTAYVFSFVIDLLPAIRTKNHTARFVKPTASDMEEANSSGNEYQGYGNGSTYYHQQNNGVAPAASMGQQVPPPQPVQTTHASNF